MAEGNIKVVNLKKEYSMGIGVVHALNGIDLEIKAGSFVAIVGTSGSGKSTLLHIMGGIDEPNEGKVFLDDMDITNMHEKDLASLRRDYVGFVFQKFLLIQELNVLENITFPARLKNNEIDTVYVDFLCEMLGISDRIEHMPSELSGGQQQRVAIARALVNKPKILLCDEPTGNLDKKTSCEVMELLIKLHKELGTTLIIVTHDMNIAMLADDIVNIEDGKIIF